jgi:hypothetical protein
MVCSHWLSRYRAGLPVAPGSITCRIAHMRNVSSINFGSRLCYQKKRRTALLPVLTYLLAHRLSCAPLCRQTVNANADWTIPRVARLKPELQLFTSRAARCLVFAFANSDVQTMTRNAHCFTKALRIVSSCVPMRRWLPRASFTPL